MQEFSFQEASARAPGEPDGLNAPGTETEHKKLEGSDEKYVVINLMEKHQDHWLRHAPAKSVESTLALLAPLKPWDKLVSGSRAARAGDAFAVMPWAEITLQARHASAFRRATNMSGLRTFKSSLEGCPYYALWPVTAASGALLEELELIGVMPHVAVDKNAALYDAAYKGHVLIGLPTPNYIFECAKAFRLTDEGKSIRLKHFKFILEKPAAGAAAAGVTLAPEIHLLTGASAQSPSAVVMKMDLEVKRTVFVLGLDRDEVQLENS